MKYARITGRPEPALAPGTVVLLADSEHVSEARLVGWNFADSRGVTGLLHVDGDRDAVLERLAGFPEVATVDAVPAARGSFYLLLVVDPAAHPVARTVFEGATTDGLVAVPPVVYRDGGVHVTLVGDPAAVQAMAEGLPTAIDAEVREIGGRGFAHDECGATLTARQREVVLAALELGYYEYPRRATHADVAAVVDSAPSTISEHLQRAEAKFVRAGMAPRPTE